MAKQPDDASEEALRSDEEIADTADDEFDEEEESDEEEEEGETRGLTPEVGSEGGSPGDVELEDKTIPARGSEAGET
jgi:hypothetical protein